MSMNAFFFFQQRKFVNFYYLISIVHFRVFSGSRVSHLCSFLSCFLFVFVLFLFCFVFFVCFLFCFLCLFFVLFSLFLFCFVFFVCFLFCLFDCLCPVSCLPNVASVSGLSIPDYASAGFYNNYLFKCNRRLCVMLMSITPVYKLSTWRKIKF